MSVTPENLATPLLRSHLSSSAHEVTLFPVQQYIDEYVQSFLQGAAGSSSAVIPLQLDASGKVKYDALARMGQSKDKVRTYDCRSLCV